MAIPPSFVDNGWDNGRLCFRSTQRSIGHRGFLVSGIFKRIIIITWDSNENRKTANHCYNENGVDDCTYRRTKIAIHLSGLDRLINVIFYCPVFFCYP